MKKNTNAVTDATSEQEQDCLNPYQPSAIANPIKRLSTRQLIGFSIISPLIACVYGLYSSWSPILFVGVILLGTPLALMALMLNRREIHQAAQLFQQIKKERSDRLDLTQQIQTTTPRFKFMKP